MSRRLITVVVCILAVVGCHESAPKETYNDCFLRNAGGASDAQVAEMIRAACAKKHQVALPQVAIDKLDGAGRAAFTHYIVDVRNGLTDWAITELDIRLANSSSFESKAYRAAGLAEPLSEGQFSFEVGSDLQTSKVIAWSIERAYGVPVRR